MFFYFALLKKYRLVQQMSACSSVCSICKTANHNLLHDWIQVHPFSRDDGFCEKHYDILLDMRDTKHNDLIASAIGMYQTDVVKCDFCDEDRLGVQPTSFLLTPTLTVHAHYDCIPCDLCHRAQPGKMVYTCNISTNLRLNVHDECFLAYSVKRLVEQTNPQLADLLALLECKREGNYRMKHLYLVEQSGTSCDHSRLKKTSDCTPVPDLEAVSETEQQEEGEEEEEDATDPEGDTSEHEEDTSEQEGDNSEQEGDTSEQEGDTSENKGDTSEHTGDTSEVEKDEDRNDILQTKLNTVLQTTGMLLLKQALLFSKLALSQLQHEEKKTTSFSRQPQHLMCDFCNNCPESRCLQRTQRVLFYGMVLNAHNDCIPCAICYTAVAGEKCTKAAYGNAHDRCLLKCATDCQQKVEFCENVNCWQRVPCLLHKQKTTGNCSVQ